MKHFIKMLSFAVLCAVFFASCSSAKKLAKEKTQQHITASVITETQTNTQTNDVVGVRTNETDFSNAFIEFIKIEYEDGTEEVNTETNAQRDTVKQRDREETEPPNSTQKIKSVTKGRVSIQNDKIKQTETNVEHNEASQIDVSVKYDIDADIEKSVTTENKPKRGFFYDFGIIATVVLVLLAGLGIMRIINKVKQK